MDEKQRATMRKVVACWIVWQVIRFGALVALIVMMIWIYNRIF